MYYIENLNKNEIYQILDKLKNENLRLKKELKLLEEKFENIKYINS